VSWRSAQAAWRWRSDLRSADRTSHRLLQHRRPSSALFTAYNPHKNLRTLQDQWKPWYPWCDKNWSAIFSTSLTNQSLVKDQLSWCNTKKVNNSRSRLADWEINHCDQTLVTAALTVITRLWYDDDDVVMLTDLHQDESQHFSHTYRELNFSKSSIRKWH